MTPVVFTPKVGPDGVLHLALPPSAAGQDVRVTVELAGPQAVLSDDAWRAGTLAMAGRSQADFERPEPGELEKREPLA
jgi:hypothetical protein